MGSSMGTPYDFTSYSWPPTGNITSTRFTTQGEYVGKGSFRVVYLGKDTLTDQPIVLKKFKTRSALEGKQWRQDIQASKEAQRFAKLFNEELKSTKPIKFIVPIIFKCPSTICTPFEGGEEVLVEPYLGKDIYQKFNSNSGWENKSCGLSMPAFSHFTYHKSEGKMLVCDLQGIKIGDQYILTDPVICSKQQDFGITDLGEGGIRSFFANHQCSDLCNSNWRKHASPKQYPNVIKGTTYLV